MEKTYKLDKGSYVIGDPGYIIKKNKEGTRFIKKVWDKFYETSEPFQMIKIKGVVLYMMRTLNGDGIFSGIATDTGTIAIINLKYLNDNDIFKEEVKYKYTKIIECEEQTEITVKDYNMYIKDVEILTEKA